MLTGTFHVSIPQLEMCAGGMILNSKLMLDYIYKFITILPLKFWKLDFSGKTEKNHGL